MIEALLISLIAAVAVRVVGRLPGRLDRLRSHGDWDVSRRRTTFYCLMTSVVRYAVDFVALVTVLDLFGVPTASLLAGAGIIGLAVGFGSQGVVQDIVTGLFLLYEDPYAVGDQITLPGAYSIGSSLGIRDPNHTLGGVNG